MNAEFKRRLTRVQMLGKKSIFIAIIVIGACAHLPSQPRSQPAYWGFTGPWDRRSGVSVQTHGSALARVVTGWIALDTTSFRPLLLYPDTIGSHPAIAERKTA